MLMMETSLYQNQMIRTRLLSTGIEGLTGLIVSLPEDHCWKVASVLLDCLLGMHQFINLDDVLASICFTLKIFSGRAPNMAWLLQTDKWLPSIFSRGLQIFNEKESPLIDLFCSMLGHLEPEQRFVALKHLGGLFNKNVNGIDAMATLVGHDHDLQYCGGSIDEKVLTSIVSGTWDQVVVLATSDTLTLLRTQAMALLRDFIPFLDRKKLQSFLAAADNVLQGFGELSNTFCDNSLLQLSLALICNACLHSLFEDLSLIPESVWRDIESILQVNQKYLKMIKNSHLRPLSNILARMQN